LYWLKKIIKGQIKI